MKTLSHFAVIGLSAILGSSPAMAYGALAVGVPADVASQGFAYGMNADSPTEDAARDQAVGACNGTNANRVQHSQASSPAQALCTLVTTFQHQCAAVAEDPAAGTPGVGWAVAPTLEVASKQALDNCMATAGESRTQFCKVDSYTCDTK
jgi:hypothetical protein